MTRKVVVTDLTVQLDADQASAFSKQSDLKGTSIELQVKETLQLTCIINVKPGKALLHRAFLRLGRSSGHAIVEVIGSELRYMQPKVIVAAVDAAIESEVSRQAKLRRGALAIPAAHQRQ